MRTQDQKKTDDGSGRRSARTPGAPRHPWGWAALVGLVSAGAFLAVAELVALIVARNGSPILALGSFVIDIVPQWAKEFAIATFGENDKLFLLLSLGVAIVVAAEGAKPRAGSMEFDTGGKDIYGHERFAGIARQLSVELERRLDKEARPVILGHVQRGGTPTAYDRVLATRFGWHAVEAVHRGEFGRMTALRGTDIVTVPLADAVETLKTVPADRYAEADCVL